MATLVVAGVSALVPFAAARDKQAGPPGMHAAGMQTERPGREIRRTRLRGYLLSYRLLDLSERGDMMKVMGHGNVVGMHESADATNHLMVYVEKPDGSAVPTDVAYIVTGPDGREFRTMTMGMYGGYGADVNMAHKGAYRIRVEILPEGDSVKLDDEFIFRQKESRVGVRRDK